MDRELTRQKVEHELILVPGGSHGLGNIRKDELLKLYERVLAFLNRHVA
jgi:hypothetical protein